MANSNEDYKKQILDIISSNQLSMVDEIDEHQLINNLDLYLNKLFVIRNFINQEKRIEFINSLAGKLKSSTKNAKQITEKTVGQWFEYNLDKRSPIKIFKAYLGDDVNKHDIENKSDIDDFFLSYFSSKLKSNLPDAINKSYR